MDIIFFFIFSVFSHEGNFFSLPFFLAALNIAYKDLANKQKYLLMSIVIIGSLGSLGYAIAFSESPDPTLVCRALLQRELPEHLCDGAISYLDQDVNYAFDFMKSQVLQSGLYRSYTIAYFLSLMLLLFIRPLLVPKKIYFFAVFFGVVPFLPLFIIAIDWGRWINFYVTLITMISLMHMNLRPHLYPLKVSNSISFKLFAFLHCFLWNMPNCCRQIEWGAVAVVKQMAAKLLVDA